MKTCALFKGGEAPFFKKRALIFGLALIYFERRVFIGIILGLCRRRDGRRGVNGWKNAGLPWSYVLERERMYFPR